MSDPRHTDQSAQISQKQDERNIYVIMKTTLLKQEYWIPKSFTVIIYLKIESYIQLKNSQRLNACNASYSCDNRNDKIVTIYLQ